MPERNESRLIERLNWNLGYLRCWKTGRNERLVAWEVKKEVSEDEKEREERKEGKMRASGYCGDGWEEETIMS